MNVVSRLQWGAAAPKQKEALKGSAQRVVIHHTALQNCRGLADSKEHLVSIQSMHMNQRGFDDIGYKWGFFLFCFLFCFSCKNCSKGKWWCNLGVKKKCYEEKHFDISAFLSEEMVLCLRAAAGESWGRIPKATTMTLWELPSWATLTVSPPFCSLTTNSIHYTYYDFFLEFQVTNWARRLYCQSKGCCCLEFPRATYIRSLFCVDTEI